MSISIRIEKGTRFNYQHKDSAPEWEVIAITGSYCDCKVISMDWRGEKRTFTKDEIRRSITMDQAFDRLVSERASFWDRQTLGAIIHYHNSFGKFLRLKVVECDGKLTGLPIAMVGRWDRHELPTRAPDGSIRLSYDARNIKDEETHRYPSDSIWEGELSDHYRALYGDPTDLPEIDLTLPPMTEGEEANAALERKLLQISALISSRARGESPRDTLDRIAALLG